MKSVNTNALLMKLIELRLKEAPISQEVEQRANELTVLHYSANKRLPVDLPAHQIAMVVQDFINHCM